MERMIKVIFVCETITPTLSSGFIKEKFQLRASSIKGLLRWWWRTFQIYEDTKELYDEEIKIFGGHGKDNISSKVKLSIQYDDSGARLIQPGDYLRQTKLPNELSYLFFSILKWDKSDYKFIRPIAREGLTFQIELIMNESFSEQVLKALWLLYVFGGIGGRTRRGLGAFKIRDIKVNDLHGKKVELKHISLFETNDDNFNKFVNRGLSEILPKNIHRKHSKYTAFSSEHKVLLRRGKDKETAIDLLNRIAYIIKRTREKKPESDLEVLKSMLSLKQLDTENINFQKSALGLPIIYNFRTQRDKRIILTAKYEDNEIQRRASPLFLSIFEYNSENYLTGLYLPAEFLPLKSRLHFSVEQRHGKSWQKLRDYTLPYDERTFISELISEIKNEFPGV